MNEAKGVKKEEKSLERNRGKSFKKKKNMRKRKREREKKKYIRKCEVKKGTPRGIIR